MLSVHMPLWPFLIRLFSFLTFGHYLIAGLILANTLSIAGLLLFHKLVREDLGERVATMALLFLLAFPGSIFFSFVYSENLFFFLAILFFVFLRRSNYLGASVAGLFMVLTRLVGIFCLVPLAWHLYENRRKLSSWLYCLVPLIGVVIYLIVMDYFTGNPLEGIQAQQYYNPNLSAHKIFDIVGFVKSFFVSLEFHDYSNSPVDRVWFVWFLATLPFIWKRSKTLFFFAFFVGLIPAMTLNFVAYTRYFLIVFPAFIVTAEFFAKDNLRRWAWLPLALLFGLQIVFLLRFVNNYWVA